jgi:hypothetical protein
MRNSAIGTRRIGGPNPRKAGRASQGKTKRLPIALSARVKVLSLSEMRTMA